MAKNKFFALLMIMFMLFTVSGCGGSGSNLNSLTNTPISQDKPAPTPEPKSDDIPITPNPSPQSQDKPVSPEPVPTPMPTPEPIISHDPLPDTIRYTVSFNSNGGSTVSNITVQSGRTISKPINPKKYGYTFKGWYKDSALTQAFIFGSNGDKVTANITLYAKWVEDSVLAEIAIEKVSIGYQDGDSANHVTKNITLPQNIDVSGDVANIIWSSNNEKVIYTNGTVTRQSTDVTVVLTALSSIGIADKSKVFTLNVIHTEAPTPSSYTVTFNSNGGSTVSSITVQSGNTIKAPSVPTKSGCTFAGWYKDSSFNNAFTFGTDGDKITGNTTLYAKWIETDRLRAEAAIGKVSIGYQEGDNANSVTKNLTLPTLVNTSGDVNVSWSSNAPSVISNSGIVTRPSDNDVVVSLTAKVTVGSEARNKIFTLTVLHETIHEPSGYTVSFDSNGGSTVVSIHVSSGDTVTMPENPTKADCIFTGWYKDEEFTQMFTFGNDGDKITDNITLYAQWVKIDTLRAEYALSEIVIGYADGDNPKYVTQNLKLPSKVQVSGDVNITWSSSNFSTISTSGIVKRPSGSDTEVTLTATAKSGTEKSTRQFNLKVIRARSRSYRSIEIVPIKDAGSGDISVKYNESGDQVTDIEGKYSRITIQNADDALDAIQGIHNELGLENPYMELKTTCVTSDTSGAEYQFQQLYNGVKVYGYGVMASANSSGEGDFLHANILKTQIIASLDHASLTLNTSSDANNAVKKYYSGNIEVISADTEQIIFALGEHENDPVYAYVVHVSGTNNEGGSVDENVIINAKSGTIILKSTNLYEAQDSTQKIVSNDNELGKTVSFPVKRVNSKYWYMVGNAIDDDLESPTIEIYSGDVSSWANTFVKRKDGEETYGWDAQAVSAYTNMREILRWWKESFDRNSLDNKGMTVKVVVHQFARNIGKDNACWNPKTETIYISDKGSLARSTASAVDVLTHESTHAVLDYITGVQNWGEQAISEGYADVFACLKDKNWTIGEDLSPNHRMRDIEVRYVDPFLEKYYDDSVHYVSYAAYLMYKNGLTWNELGKLWYKSMSMGYQSKHLFWTEEKKILNEESKFDDVQRCLIWAAEKLAEAGELPREKISCIWDALAEVFYRPASLNGTVTDYDTGKPVKNALVGVNFSSNSYSQSRSTYTDENGRYSIRLYNENGKCEVNVYAEGYSGASIYGVEIEGMKESTLDIQVVRQGDYSISGTIRDMSDDSPIENVRVALRTGFNNMFNYEHSVTATDENGRYSFNAGSISTGHYTVELRKTGYKTTRFNVFVYGDMTEQDGYMTKGTTFRHEISKIDAEININTLVSDSSGKGWIFRDGVLTLNDNLVYKINGNGKTTTNSITVNHGNDVAVILNNVSIDVRGMSDRIQYDNPYSKIGAIYPCAFDMTGANVELFLEGENTLLSWGNRAGLEVPDGASITIRSIHGEDGNDSDSLYSRGGNGGGAGIGGPGYGEKGRAGTIIIYSGKIYAVGNGGGAGIGGGDTKGPDGGGLIIIYGGNVTGTIASVIESYPDFGAGIGTGDAASGSNQTIGSDNTKIFILGGTIAGYSSYYGAGIGGGDNSDSGTIRILEDLRGKITAVGGYYVYGYYAIGIGAGMKGKSDVQYLGLEELEKLVEKALIDEAVPEQDNEQATVSATLPPTEYNVNDLEILPYAYNGNHDNSAMEILAILPTFTATKSETYTFTVSFDSMPPEGASLVLLADSEDIHGSFALTESPDTVIVSADFTAGRTYTPVIVAMSEGEHQGGGCNAGIAGIILLAGIMVAMVKKS